MVKELDCRNLACPGPVIQAKRMIDEEKPNIISVLVDNEAAVENVSRFLGSRQYKVSITAVKEGIRIVGQKEDNFQGQRDEIYSGNQPAKKILVLVSNDRLGHGDDSLGKKLMLSFLSTLKELGEELWRLVFLNNGVKLAAKGSEVLPVLKELEKHVTILVCGTCLAHFELLDLKEAGETTNMLDIVTAMQLADKVITI
ncbi:MAG: sulfurtransferase-like selenium metabolism protein YedF [Desulfobacteraceae bacterium]|jgi:selenium metabolism protein YedF|nr:MAG: sulfurtransferase-like selenium metabolism protein YedF [Desulfobacteraceae bacterium]